MHPLPPPQDHLWLQLQLLSSGMSLSALHIWILVFLPILLSKIAQDWSDWMEMVSEQQV